MGRLAFDLRFALRNLSRGRLFTIVAIASLALGIGANTAVFSLMDQLLLRLLPVSDPDRLVMVWSTGPHMGSNRGTRMVSYPMYEDFQRKASAFSSLFCRFETAASITFDGHTERITAELVSGNFFQALGVRAALGRVFSPEQDDRTYKGHPSVVLSYQYWTTRFSSDPGVIGRKIILNDYPMTVVGVSAPGFNGVDPSVSPQVRVPIQMKPLMTPGWDEIGNRRYQWIQVFGRLKPGYTVESAKASLQPLFQQILQQELTEPLMRGVTPYDRGRFLARKIRMEPAGAGFSQMREQYSKALVVLMCMVGLVLLIACFNVANLLIARAMARQKEVAVRLAVGGSRRQILGQLLMESLLLSAAGALAGLFLAQAMIRGLLSFLPTGDTPLMLRPELDLRVLAFNAALALVTGVLFGLAPAFQGTRIDLWSTLKDVVGAVTVSRASVALRKTLVVAQVALSFLLLAGAGLFLRTLTNLRQMNPGFNEIDKLIKFEVDPALNGYSLTRLQTFNRQLLQNIRGLPGVKSAAYAIVPVLHGWEWDSTMSVEGHRIADGEDMQAFMNAISPGYWQTMGVRLLEGRDFDDRDEGKDVTVAIVNRQFATHFFGDKSAIGTHIGFGSGPQAKLNMQIIGVVDNSLYEGPRDGIHRQAFISFPQVGLPTSVSFYVRTALDPAAMFTSVRQAVRRLDPAMPVYDMKTLDRQLDETLGTERLIATLSAAFGAVATLLAAIGLYGVMAFVVARRTREIGLRMALGARQGAVLWMIMRETLVLLGAGLLIGIPAVFLLSRYVASQLFGVKPNDLFTAGAALLLLSAIAAGAGFLPARRASVIDPMRALHYE